MVRPMLGALAALVAAAACASFASAAGYHEGHAHLSVPKKFSREFEDKEVAEVPNPTDLYFSPDGKYCFVTSKFGKVWRLSVKDMEKNDGDPEEVFDVTDHHDICLNGARGLAGIAVHPQYPAKPYIYLFHNYDKYNDCSTSLDMDEGPVNRFSRWTLNEDLKSVDPKSELVMFETQRLNGQTHNAGDIEFGADGTVYVTVGEGGTKKFKDRNGTYMPISRSHLNGSVIRMTDDGGIPHDNPYSVENSPKAVRCNEDGNAGKSKEPCQEVYMTGFRNPFRFALDPNAAQERGETRFFVNDVGSNTWEMIKEVTDSLAGKSYGYPIREGPCENGMDSKCRPDEDFVDPIYSYHHDKENGGAITGGAFLPNDAGWPLDANTYFYSEFSQGGIYAMTPDKNMQCDYPKCDPPHGPFRVEAFSEEIKIVNIAFGPHKGGKALYYMTHRPGGTGKKEFISRIAYTGEQNRDPKAAIDADVTVGFLPMTVNFDGTKSTDPDDGDKGGLNYEWDFDGDGMIDSTSAKPSFTYKTGGVFRPTLTVYDGKGGVDYTEIRIDVDNIAPIGKILSPPPGTTFAVGDRFVLKGSGFDAEDGDLPDTSLSWEIRQHHNKHYHPFLDATIGNNIKTDPAPEPEDFYELTTTTSYLSIHLTVTDSSGLTTTTVREIHPRLVNLKFDSIPSGMDVLLNHEKFTTPVSLIGWENHKFEAEALTQTGDSGAGFSLKSWSKGEIISKKAVIYTTPSIDPIKPVIAKFHAARPIPAIHGVDKDTYFSVGDTFVFEGSALDIDGKTPMKGASLTWEVRLYDVNRYGYKVLVPAGTEGGVLVTPQIPEPNGVLFNHHIAYMNPYNVGYGSPDMNELGYLEVILTATDKEGLSDSTRVFIEPDIVTITLETKPSNLEIIIDGEAIRTPATVSTWRMHRFTVGAADGQYLPEIDDRMHIFDSWATGVSRYHNLKARSDGKLVATFTEVETLPRPQIVGALKGGIQGNDNFEGGRDTFSVGDEFVFTSIGYNKEGKELDYYATSWKVYLHSGNGEVKEVASEPGRDLYFVVPQPAVVQGAQDGYIEVITTTHEFKTGYMGSRTLRMDPNLVNVQVKTLPAGLAITVDGETVRDKHTFTAWQGQSIVLDVPDSDPKIEAYTLWKWGHTDWSDDVSASTQYVVPNALADGSSRMVTASFGVGERPAMRKHGGGKGVVISIVLISALLVIAIFVVWGRRRNDVRGGVPRIKRRVYEGESADTGWDEGDMGMGVANPAAVAAAMSDYPVDSSEMGRGIANPAALAAALSEYPAGSSGVRRPRLDLDDIDDGATFARLVGRQTGEINVDTMSYCFDDQSRFEGSEDMSFY